MRDRLTGLLLGAAVGDALGLPAEGLAPERRRRLYGDSWRHRLVAGRGMLSDDTEHAFCVAQSLLEHPSDVEAFRRALARRLRWWLAALPAGVGFATLRALLKLSIGVPVDRAGVASAGNGPAMRAPLIGGYFSRDAARRDRYVAASTRLTHTDPRALTGARAVALAATHAVRDGPALAPDALLDECAALSDGDEWRIAIGRCREALSAARPVRELAADIGCARGVTGYVFHTVPVALHAFLSHPASYADALVGALDCGGDTDTVGAITGALAGARGGVGAIPSAWIDGIADRPLTPGLLALAGARLAEQASDGTARGPLAYAWPLTPLRNAIFLAVVLGHGARRALPPY